MGSTQSRLGSSSSDSGLKRFSRVDLKSAFKSLPHKENVKHVSTTQAEVRQNPKGDVAGVAGGTTESAKTDYETPIYETTTTTTQVSLMSVWLCR